MKRCFLLLALVCLLAPLGLRAQVTVSGNLKDAGVANVTASNTYVRFTLTGFGGNIPRVTSTNVIAVPYKDFKPDASGNISGTVQGNDTITIGGASLPGGTWYQVCIFYWGQQFRCQPYTINGSLFNLNTATPNSTVPTVPAPTGDNTYIRKDGGNSPIPGPLTLSGGVTSPAITGSTLTAGNCVQASTGGLLTTASGPCGTNTPLTSPVTTPSPLNFDVDLGFKGPNPNVDIRRYGARSLLSNANIPAVPGITASTTSGLATVTVSTATCAQQTSSVCFLNGDGVVVFGAGAAHTMTTPGAPTVTPSRAAALTGTGFTVAAPAGGTTTYNYQLVAQNKAGGLTAASAVGTTAIGSASLGPQQVAITSYSRSGTTVTVTTTAAHGLSVGSMVYQEGSSDTTNFGGWFQVVTVADTTHYTYSQPLDTASGAPTGAGVTGGNAHWFNCNHLTWTSVAGAIKYYIYGRTGGALTLLGVSSPDNGSTALSWDDFGSPMMDGFLAPYFVPTTPPVAATNNSLSTTIVSGAGTTTLTLANTAGATLAAATILFDNAPTILAAHNAARLTTFGTLYIPVASTAFVVNSYLTLGGFIGVNVAGSLLLNDTVEPGSNERWFGNLTPQQAGAPSFAWEAQNAITVGRANPGIYQPFTSATSPSFHNVGFTTNQTNAYSLMFLEGDFNVLDNVNFFGGTTNADQTGVGLTLRGSNTNTAFPNKLTNITFVSPQVTPLGATATPFFLCSFCGETLLDNISMSGRSIAYTPSSSNADFHLKGGRIQGGIMPLFTAIPSIAGTIGGFYSFQNYELDTMAHAMYANLPVAGSGSNASALFVNTGAPSSALPYITGSPAGAAIFTSTGGPVGQNTNVVNLSTGFFSNNSVQVNGTLGSIGYQMSTPAAPTAVVSAGGSVPVGTWFYQLTALDANGNESNLSSNVTVTTTTGNQTVTITPPAAPTGSVTYKAYRHNPGGGQGAVNAGPNAWGTNMVDTFGFTAGAPPAALALASGLSQSNINASAIVLSGGFKNTISGTFTANRTLTVPDATDTLALLAATQTLTNKTLTSPTLTTPVLSGTISGPATFSGSLVMSNASNSLQGVLNLGTTSASFGGSSPAFIGGIPTISSGFGTAPSLPVTNDSISFTINVGTGGTATSGVIGFPTAASSGWNVFCEDVTTFSTTVFRTRQTASTTTTATIGNFNSSAVAAPWAASDILSCIAVGR